MGSEKVGGGQRNQELDAKKQKSSCLMAERSSSNNGSSAVKGIPQDQLFSILLLLPVESILSFSMTCKKLKSLANSDSLWESVCRRDWGNAPVEALQAASNHLPWKKLYQQVYQLESVFCCRLLTDASDGVDSVPTPRASHSLNLVSGCLLLFGGGCTGGKHLDDTWAAYAGTDDLKRTLKWQKMNAGIPSGRFGHSCVVVGEHLILFGGINDLGVRQTDTWIGQVGVDHPKHCITMSWRLLDVGSNSPPPRGAHAACCIGDREMLVHGGIGLSARRLDDTWILQLSQDLSCGSWQKIESHPCPPSRSGHTLTHIGGTQIILFGGRGMGYEVLNDVWLFDSSDDEWRWTQLLFEVRNVPQGLSLARVGHSANLIIGRRLLIYGGEDSGRHRKDDFWVLDISSMPCVKMQRPRFLKQNRVFRRMWRRLESKGEKPNSRSFHGACVDGSGRFLYIYGGMVDGLIQPADSAGLRFDGEIFLVDLLLQP